MINDKDMRSIYQKITEEYRLKNISIMNLDKNNLILERTTDGATISIIPTSNQSTYSAQIEVPDDSVPWLGIAIPFANDELSEDELFNVIKQFLSGK